MSGKNDTCEVLKYVTKLKHIFYSAFETQAAKSFINLNLQ